MPHDACYYKVKSQYQKFPSARASQALGMCRKEHGHAKKSAAGSSIRRWGREKWKDRISGKPCGSGGSVQYCRPSHKVSKKTPTMYKGNHAKRMIAKKRSGRRAV